MSAAKQFWPRSSGECLFSGGHALQPRGTSGPQYCVMCGRGYEKYAAARDAAASPGPSEGGRMSDEPTKENR